MSAPIVTDDIRDEINGAEFWQMRAWVEDLLPEVDRLRAENTALARKCEQLTLHSLGCPASPGTSCEFTDHGPCLVHSLRAENAALAATVNELAILFEDHTGAPPHISTGVVEPIR